MVVSCKLCIHSHEYIRQGVVLEFQVPSFEAPLDEIKSNQSINVSNLQIFPASCIVTCVSVMVLLSL